jgi:hypothetical protein
MTRDDIIRMAQEAHLDVYGLGTDHEKFVSVVERFANLVAAAEREACAVMINILQKSGVGGQHLIDAIRERGAP